MATSNRYDLVSDGPADAGTRRPETIQALHKRGFEVPVVAVTGLDLVTVKDRCRRAGFDDILNKDEINPTRLRVF